MRNQLEVLVADSVRAGLELEYEQVAADVTHNVLEQAHPEHLWRAKTDNSLRPNDLNTELTFRGGLSGSLILEALEQLDALEHLEYRMSWRCGMHVHTDYSGLRSSVAYRALMISAVLEPVLFAWAGPARQESKFCTPTRQISEYVLRNENFAPKKYSAFNLAPLTTQGTAELRIGDTTRDKRKMLDYINLGFDLRRLGLEFQSGWHILETMTQEKDAASWIDRYMHKLVSPFLIPAATALAADIPWELGFASAVRMADFEHQYTPFIVNQLRRG